MNFLKLVNMCLKKVPVLNKETNKVSYYPCGHCAVCINNKARRLKHMCQSQTELSEFQLFVTLTYAPEFLPRVAICTDFVTDEDGRNCFEVAYVSQCDRVTEYYKDDVLHVQRFYDGREFDKFELPLRTNKFNLGYTNEIGILFRYDVQLWMKRVRERLSDNLALTYFNNPYKKLKDNEKAKIKKVVTDLKVFICGEYGPKTFRPHYHVLLYFKRPEVFDFLFNNVDKIWKYGRVDVQSAGKDANGYVSGYVNSFVGTPPLLRTSFSRPFSQHSLFFGVDVKQEYVKEIREVSYKRLREKCVVVDGKYQNYTYPVSLENLLFPKTYRFAQSTHYQLCKRYSAYETLSRYFAEKSVKKLVKLYLNEMDSYVWMQNDLLHNTFPKDLLIPYSDTDESTLTTLLYTSRKFLRNAKYFNLSVSDYVSLIKRYYDEKESVSLHENFKLMCAKSIFYDDIRSYGLYYDNIVLDDSYYFPKSDHETKNVRLSHYNTVRDFCRSIDVSNKDLLNYLSNPSDHDAYYLSEVILQDKILHDNMKHKKQNDANQIFL